MRMRMKRIQTMKMRVTRTGTIEIMITRVKMLGMKTMGEKKER